MSTKKKKASHTQFQGASPTPLERDALVDLFSAGRGEDALKLAQHLTKKYPAFVFGWKVINIYLRQEKQFEDAHEALVKCQQFSNDDPEVFNLLGITLEALNRHEDAIKAYEEALRIGPLFLDAYSNLGDCLVNIGQAHLGIDIFNRGLNIAPDNIDLMNRLGESLRSIGELEKSYKILSDAVRIDASSFKSWINLGLTEEASLDFDQALLSYDKALKTNIDNAIAFLRLGEACFRCNQLEAAESHFRNILAIDPTNFAAMNNLAVTLHSLGLYKESEQYSRQALENSPDNAIAYLNLANVLQSLMRFEEAEAYYYLTIGLNSQEFVAYNNLGNVYQYTHRLLDAEIMYRKAISINDAYPLSHNNLGTVLKDLGRFDEAELCYRRALELEPDYPEAYSSLLFTLNYHPDKSSEAIFAAYQEYDRRFCVPLRDQCRPFGNNPEPNRRLRVGYVSPDFRFCSARHFLEPLLANHDKSAVEVFAYAQLAVEDEMTAVYKGYVDHWVPSLGMSDAALAERIRADQIDILVDTAGHSAHHRLGVFARKPAPVSLSWLGFGYTTGLSAIDYFLTDEITAPPGSEYLFSETPWPLDPIPFAYRPAHGMGEVNPLPALSKGYVTFGTLTRSIRINHRTIGVWAQILQQVPNARLVIDSSSYKEAPMQDSLAELFAAQGISRDRLDIGCHSPWDTLRGIDIGLDCFPHNSGTTLFETLYMGIPFITLADRPGMGRLGSSILRALGRSEWIAQTEAEYVRKAVALAGDLSALASNRAVQRGQMKASPLMDELTHARKVEAAYRTMFGRWCDLSN